MGQVLARRLLYNRRLCGSKGESKRGIAVRCGGSQIARCSQCADPRLAADTAVDGNPASFSIFDTPIGVTPRYIGYNMGHYMLGSNTTAWTQYSGVNAYRVWAGPNDYEPTDDTRPTAKRHDASSSMLERLAPCE